MISNDKKILFFISGSYIGGLEIVTLGLLQGLKEKNYSLCCIISGWNDGMLKKKLISLDIKFFEVKLGWLYFRKPLWTLDTLINMPYAYLKCKKIIKAFNPDVFHFCNYAMPIMLYPLINRQSIYVLHDTQLPIRKHRIIYKFLNRKIDYFVAVSNHIFKTLENLQIPSSKIKLIYNGILPPLDTHYSIIESDTIQLGIIGQIREGKGHETLINAIEKLIIKGIKNFHLNIYGNNNNSYSSFLKNIIKSKDLDNYITWKGFIINQDIIYNNIHIVIVPSLVEEAFSLTTAEGMMRGKGVIVSNQGGMVELIDNNINGFIFSSANDKELSECLYLLIKDKKKIEFLGFNAKKKSVESYSYRVMTENYIKLYLKAVKFK